MRRMRRSRSLLAIVAAITMTLALGIPVAADLNLVPGDSAQIAYTNGDGINVRDVAGYSGAIITTLHEGIEVSVVDGPVWADDGSGWYYISVDTSDGWVEGWAIADYISGDPSVVRYEAVAGAAVSSGSAAVVGTDGYGLRLRDGATTAAGVIAVMPEGASVGVIQSWLTGSDGGSWAQVTYGGMTGYASMDYLSIGGGNGDSVEPAVVASHPVTSGLSVGDRAAVSGTGGGGLNVRSEAYYGAGVLTVVPEGNVVVIVDGPAWDGEGNGWYQVDYLSTVGWVHGGYLAWTDAAPTSPTLESVTPPAQQPVEQPPAEQPAAPIAPVSGVGDAIVSEALNYVGLAYVWGGTTPAGFDCSGFTYYVVNRVTDAGLSRSLEVQSVSGAYVDPENLQPGDLVFQQNTYKWGLSHVGIYIGGGKMVNAQSENVGVAIASIWDSYWGSRYYTARRVG